MDATLILSLNDIQPLHAPLVGGKGANLGVLTRLDLPVPGGFCVTTDAWRQWTQDDTLFATLLKELAAVEPGDLDQARRLGAKLREHLTGRAVAPTIDTAIRQALSEATPQQPWAVRSSATAEDLPDASFAGQQDTYLNIVGADAVVDRVRACWASLFTDRAILYRLQQDIPHADVAVCVVVQRMVQPRASGILFTADPITGHRGVMAIDAGFGLGEALVSGTVSADLYRIDRETGTLLEVRVGDKRHAVRSIDGGGTEEQTLNAEQAAARVLRDSDLTELRVVGDRIESAQGTPQDIEWCFDDNGLKIVQARPITSLYPLPGGKRSAGRLWFCFNHFQVMTDAMPPLVCDIWRLLLPFGRDPKRLDEPMLSPWMAPAAGRLFIDMGPAVRHPMLGRVLRKGLGGIDELALGALEALVARPEFAKGSRVRSTSMLRFAPVVASMQRHLWIRPPEEVLAERNRWMAEMVERRCAEILAPGQPEERLARAWRTIGTAFTDLIELPPIVLAGVAAAILLKRQLPEHQRDVDALGRGLTGNVTVEMDLAVGDLADAARAAPDVATALVAREPWQDAEGAAGFSAALDTFLDDWGFRAPSEIDWSRPRWRDDPSSLLTVIAGNLAHSDPGSHREKHAQFEAEGEAAAARLIDAASGPIQRRIVKRLIRVHRNLMPMREHPKLAIVKIGYALRQLLLETGATLTNDGKLSDAQDVWFLEWREIEAALAGNLDPRAMVEERRAAHARYQTLSPPRLMSGDGEIPRVSHTGDAPGGAIAGTAASSGVVEGIARVVRDPTRDVLHKGEILVAPFTDPGWTPLFINASALVMEVGGLMTHGSVVAREYGIPAVVCVPDATTRIATGQRIRVDGDGGWVELLDDDTDSAPVAAAAAATEPL